jgi:hypothetical protein
MSRPDTLAARVREIIDHLDARIEAATFQEGADRQHCVAVVGCYHTLAGRLERDLDSTLSLFNEVRELARRVRQLKRIVRDHAMMVERAGMLLRAQRRAEVARVIKQAQRGTR